MWERTANESAAGIFFRNKIGGERSPFLCSIAAISIKTLSETMTRTMTRLQRGLSPEHFGQDCSSLAYLKFNRIFTAFGAVYNYQSNEL